MSSEVHIRKRVVCLARDGSSRQAGEACAALRGVKGVRLAEPINNYRLKLVYSLEDLSFELIEGLLRELGFRLDDRLFAILRRNIYQYLEDTAREKIQVAEEQRKLVCDLDPDVAQDEPEKYWTKYR
jgi:hypothetical protein